MIQLYFMSILLNGLAGCLFILEDSTGESSVETSMRFSLFGDGFRLILGILAAITGVLKLFSPYHESEKSIYILGDLIPAVAGVAAGFMLIFGFYRKHSSRTDDDDEENLDRFGNTFLRYKKVIGIALVITALLHFLFPRALFL